MIYSDISSYQALTYFWILRSPIMKIMWQYGERRESEVRHLE